MPRLDWDPKTEPFNDFCRRQDRANIDALRSPATFRYEHTPTLSVSYSCSGDDCGYDSIVQDDDVLVCTTCKTRWSMNEAYDGVDGEPIQDQGELSAKALAALPVKEW
ncbi:hypothetical protein [Rhodococcus koreensis]|uniref:hypothetical protein n=1 Tax=Rhodococcus koreensis TaxID=99653 RepID=UPI003670A265